MNAAHRISELEETRNTAMLGMMNAAQIIEEIQRLPEEEKSKVVDFLRHQPNAETIAAMEEAEHPENLEKFDSAADMFEKLGIEC